jgi:hypothetical protein
VPLRVVRLQSFKVPQELVRVKFFTKGKSIALISATLSMLTAYKEWRCRCEEREGIYGAAIIDDDFGLQISPSTESALALLDVEIKRLYRICGGDYKYWSSKGVEDEEYVLPEDRWHSPGPNKATIIYGFHTHQQGKQFIKDLKV